jgi:hypothetical protein
LGYIQRNPLEAGLVLEPWQDAWSSCGVYACGTAGSLLAENLYCLESGADDSSRRRHWRGLLMHKDPKEPLIRHAHWAPGDESFPKQLQEFHGRAVQRRRGRPPKEERNGTSFST